MGLLINATKNILLKTFFRTYVLFLRAHGFVGDEYSRANHPLSKFKIPKKPMIAIRKKFQKINDHEIEYGNNFKEIT